MLLLDDDSVVPTVNVGDGMGDAEFPPFLPATLDLVEAAVTAEAEVLVPRLPTLVPRLLTTGAGLLPTVTVVRLCWARRSLRRLLASVVAVVETIVSDGCCVLLAAYVNC